MPVQFTCPHCGAQTNVGEEYVGRSGPCAQCGKTVTVPLPAVPPGYAPPPKKSSGVPVLVVLVIVGGVFLVCGGIMVALLLPAVQAAREAARRAACTNNLRQIGVAMQTYHDTYKCFPPAYIPDENGKPMHSWRVLLLPFMEQEGLHAQYNFEEPWDSPNNRVVADTMLPLYRCPSAAGQTFPPQTDYVMIVGPGTISDGPTPTGIGQIADGTSNTIMIVEVANSGINWTEPKDLGVDEVVSEIGRGAGRGGGGNHPRVTNVLFCDGRVQGIDGSIDPETLQGLTTISGGENVSRFSLEY